VITAISFLLAAAVCQVEFVDSEKRPSLLASLRGALSDVRLRLFAAAAFLSSVAVSTLLVFQVPTMTWAGVSTATAAALASLRGLMQLAGRIPLLAAINRYTAPKLIVIARVLLGFSALFLLGSGNIALALIYIVLAGVTIGALSALDGVVARDIVQPEVFGTVMGGIGLVATLGGSLGPIFAGWLRDLFDSPVAPMLIVLFAACSAAIIFAMQQSVSRTSQATQ
jgi:MFS family permease